MKKIFPEKLKRGDEVRIVAPSRSMSIISEEVKQVAADRFKDLGLRVSFSENIEESDIFQSSSIESRVNDLHNAFANKNVKGVITTIGGYSCNQLLNHLDWDLIKKNPKVFCGYSDITILNNAIFAKTGLINYYGPHYSTFGQKLYFDYTLDYFKKCIMNEEPFDVVSSGSWSDDYWYKEQDNRNLVPNTGCLVINEGSAEGTALGGNIGTFGLLQGTKYFPDIRGSILFLEDDDLVGASADVEFDRGLQSLIHQPGFSGVVGLAIGRFQKAGKMNDEKITKIIKSKKELEKIPVIAGVDFGHTDPKVTIPIGGEVDIIAGKSSRIEFIRH